MDSEQQEDLRRIVIQEQRLRFKAFDKAAAWELGLRLKALCEEAGVNTTIEIRLARETVFFYAMPETASSHADWARRKRNVVELMGQSSYRVGLSFEDGHSLEASMGLPPADYACHGGSFPLHVEGVGFIGVVTVSGLPQRQDHALVVRALAEMCGVELADVALTP